MLDTPSKTPGTDSDLRAQRDAIIKTLPTRSPIYLPTEKIDLAAQIEGLGHVRDIYADMERKYGPKLRALRDKYKGRDRAFIIGNGPSLNETDLSQLRDEVTFCVNGFFLKMPDIDWTPTFYVVEDHLVAEDRADRINAFKGPTKLFPAYLGYCLDRGDDTIFYNHRPRVSYPHGFDFSTEADKITYTGCTVTFSCMQLAHYMGFRELYLIGVDASYDIPDDAEESKEYGTGVLDNQSDDTNHFHPDYFGKGYRWHDPQVGMMIEAYTEAEKVTSAMGRPIYNATIGGMLEVFERRSFHDIFPDAIPAEAFRAIPEDVTPEERTKAVRALVDARDENVPDTAESDAPKVCIIDMTPLGGATATGELKATLFGDYPGARLMEVFSTGHTMGVRSQFMPGADGRQKLSRTERVLDYIIDFDPDVILFRPTPEKPNLTAVAEAAYQHTGARFLTWIMDGWQDRLIERDPAAGKAADDLLQTWFARSHHSLAISDAMATAYGKRYGTEFTALANAVDPDDWTHKRSKRKAAPSKRRPFVLRYSGGLAPDMSLQTLTDLAEAVEELAETTPIRFEVNTRSHWIREQGGAFDAFPNTHLTNEEFSVEDYRAWIAGGDVSLIAYNFSDETRTYVGYSMANKLPECLASGSPLLAIGPRELATIDYMVDNGVGHVVAEPGVAPLVTALRKLIDDADYREALSREGRAFAFRYRSLDAARTLMRDLLQSAARAPEREHEDVASQRTTLYAKTLSRTAAAKPAAAKPAATKTTLARSAPQPASSSVVPPKPKFRKGVDFSKHRKAEAGGSSPAFGPMAQASRANHAELKQEIEALRQEMRRNAQSLGAGPSYMAMERVRTADVAKLYMGKTGAIAFIALLLSLLPALPLPAGWPSMAVRFAPALGVLILLYLFGRWAVQLTYAVQNR